MSAEEPEGQPELAAVLQQFPPVAHAFAYGSGVFRQPGLYPLGSGDRPMLDFIFAVDAPAQWHAQVRSNHRRSASVQQHGLVPSVASKFWLKASFPCRTLR